MQLKVSFAEDDEKPKVEPVVEKPSKEVAHVLDIHHVSEEKPRTFSTLFTIPEKTSSKIWWFYTWPIYLILTTLLPHPKVHRKLYPLTFILCILMIGANSYLVYWMVAIIGHTISIPESVMGMTLLAGGGCLPEAISCVIVIRKGG